MWGSRNLIALAVTGVLAVGLSACGGSSSSSSSGGGTSAKSSSSSSSGVQAIPLKPGENPAGQVLTGPTKKKGGVLTAYTSEDFAHLDPGESYFTNDYIVDYATQRPLFSYMPNTADTSSARTSPPRSRRRPTAASPTAARPSPSTSARACPSARRSTAR